MAHKLCQIYYAATRQEIVFTNEDQHNPSKYKEKDVGELITVLE
jgi:hypothetical protein